MFAVCTRNSFFSTLHSSFPFDSRPNEVSGRQSPRRARFLSGLLSELLLELRFAILAPLLLAFTVPFDGYYVTTYIFYSLRLARVYLVGD